jgi:uncharacterized protein
MIGNLSRLALLTGNDAYRKRADIIHRTFAGEARNNPFGYASFTTGLIHLLDPIQLVLVGENDVHDLRTQALELLGPDIIMQSLAPSTSLPADHPAFGKIAASRYYTAYLCRGMICAAPATEPAQLTAAIEMLQLNRSIPRS